ncbi:MAG: hypothetical protein SFV24_12850 [Gemmatimonadales bacterium]|nr:hypothetical protein [Gemmatimonadota bacterium]MDX2058685.1 hypothetical protein [Gemmatimonadales bacterium]
MSITPVLLNRYTQDLSSDSRGLARYIGNLEEGRSKVSVNSSLSVGDKADFFRFRVTSDQFVRLSTGELVGEKGKGVEVAKKDTVRYQLFSASGQVVADSDSGAGEAYDNWVALNSGKNLELTRGTYALKVARGTEAINAKEYVYSFTFKSGVEAIADDAAETASREFLTTERPAAGLTYDQTGGTAAVLGLFTDVRVF